MWNRTLRYTRIKLCEFESLDAAYEASLIGADALGFHLFRHQDVKERVARFQAIFHYLPMGLERVLLTDLDLADLKTVLGELSADSIQLYPDWSVEQVFRLKEGPGRPRILKVLSAQPEENYTPDFSEFLSRYANVVDGFLLDSFRAGGTGKTADWAQCAAVVRQTDLPVFLGGGLTADNVSEAIQVVRPFGVDVESGVSSRVPGGPLLKNLEKCRQFVDAVQRADREYHRLARYCGLPPE